MYSKTIASNRTSLIIFSILFAILIAYFSIGSAELGYSYFNELRTANREALIFTGPDRYKRDVGKKPVIPAPHSNGTSSTKQPTAIQTTKLLTKVPTKPPTNAPSARSTSKSTRPATSMVPKSKVTSLISTKQAHYDARDIAYFLESHPAHSIYDPRVYFTEERTSRSLAIVHNEISHLPERLRFAFMVRVYNELGRKIATKLNYFSTEVAAILRKTPDDLGNKPEVSMLVDAVNTAFESKEDRDPKEESDQEATNETPISSLIKGDNEKAAVFNSSLVEIATRLAHIVAHFGVTTIKTSVIKIQADQYEAVADVLGESIQMGAKTLIEELSKSDKFRVPDEVVDFSKRMFNQTLTIFKRHMKDLDDRVGLDYVPFQGPDVKSFEDLNPISDATGLIGSWNNYLFVNLGSSERVIKLFAGLLSRVPLGAKSRWINMYISQVYSELERTLSGFVVMQGMPYNRDSSEKFLLNPKSSANIVPNKLPKPRTNYAADKNRIPARCYLAGRRWRLVLARGLQDYASREEVIKAIADKLGEFKVGLTKQSGNEIYRLCMPKLEVGLRGWGINGDPQSESSRSDKFPLKNPIENLDRMPDPFEAGAHSGYKTGFKVGYNEERNATLEMERTSHLGGPAEQAKSEALYIAKASYRRAATVSAKEAFRLGVREGYLTTLKVSLRAGLLIISEAASRLASLKCVSFAGQAGKEEGRLTVESYIAEKKVSDTERQSLIKVGEENGLLAGQVMGKTIGAIIGKEAAEEAYRRGIIRGGKVARAKFHLEEYEAGANLAFEFGLKEGKRIASSSGLDPSAPRFLRFEEPVFSGNEKPSVEVDHWEKDLIPPLTSMDKLHEARNHTSVSGSLRGVYKVAKEVKKGMKRVAYSNMTYNLEVFASGFIKNQVAYLTLNGTVNKIGTLRGSIIARDIFNEDKNS